MLAPLGCALLIALLATPSVERSLIRADSLFLAFQADAALALLDSLELDPNIRQNAALRLDYLLTRGKILSVMHRPLLAEPPLQAALELAESRNDSTKLCQVLRFLAYAEETKGESELARGHYTRLLNIALKRNDAAHEAFGRLGLAYDLMQRGDPSSARAGYERAIALFRETHNARYEIIAMMGLSRCQGGLGDLAGQRTTLLQVVARARALRDPYQEAHALNNLGGSEYLFGDPAVALEHYRQSARLFERNVDPLGMVTPIANQGMALADLGRLDEAKQVLRRALSICRVNGFASEAAAVLEQLGTVQLRADRPDSAAALFRECLRTANLQKKTHDEGRLGLARALAARDSSDAALALLQFAMQDTVDVRIEQELGALLLQRGHSEDAANVLARVTERAESERRIEVAVASLTLLARAQRRLHQPEAARASLLQACELWEAGRGRSLDPQWREQLGKDARTLYGELASLLAQGADPAGSIFDQLQRFKARTLQERLSVPSGVAPDSQRVRRPVTLRETQSTLLREGELLLDVFLSDEAALLLAVDRENCLLLQFDPQLELPQRVRRWLNLVTGSQVGASEPTRQLVDAAAASIGRDLLDPLAPLLRRSRRILFVPDGEWNGLALEALLWQAQLHGPWVALAETHEVVRLASTTLLAELRTRAATTPSEDGSFYVVAGSAPELPALPSMQHEVRRLVRRYAHSEAIGTTQGSALQTQQLTQARLLHFASHIEIDRARPWRSAIRVALADSLQSNRLEAAQVAELDLNAQLAFLSGCESASGQVLSGEGVLGLSAAFLAAGVPTVVATLWPVHDLVAARFVDSFYNGLADGATAAASLRQAQAGLRASASTSDPFDWAAFVLLGEGDVRIPLRTRSTGKSWAFAVLITSAASLLLWRLRHRATRV